MEVASALNRAEQRFGMRPEHSGGGWRTGGSDSSSRRASQPSGDVEGVSSIAGSSGLKVVDLVYWWVPVALSFRK